MRLALHDHAEAYRRRGYTLIPGVVTPAMAAAWADRLQAARTSGLAVRVECDDEAGEIAAGIGGRLAYHVVDGRRMQQVLPEAVAVYHSLLPLLSAVTGEDVIVSPYERSAIVGKLYGPGGGQGWHFDTNGITALLFLTGNPEAPTVLRPLDTGIEEHVSSTLGGLFVMRGREVWHRASTPLDWRVILPGNYYVAGDTWRPDGLDDKIYGPEM